MLEAENVCREVCFEMDFALSPLSKKKTEILSQAKEALIEA